MAELSPELRAVAETIARVQGLGPIESLTRAGEGRVNHTLILNNRYVLRIDRMNLTEPPRYAGEALAFETLRAAGLPAPEVIAVDATKADIPHEYMVMTRLEGASVVQSWPALTERQQIAVSREAGEFLARMHDCRFEHFGKLGLIAIPDGGFVSLYNYLHDDFFARYVGWGLNIGAITPQLAVRIDTLLQHCHPVLDQITQGHLIHRDYHWENIMQANGRITGIIDFEWSASGDPACDFAIDDQWGIMCPGSTSLIREGYESVRSLPADHALREALNRALKYLDFAVEAYNPSGNLDEYAYEHARLIAALEAAERLISE